MGSIMLSGICKKTLSNAWSGKCLHNKMACCTRARSGRTEQAIASLMGDYFLTCSNHIELLQCWLPPTTSLWNVTPVFTLIENHITATSICEVDEEEIWYFILGIYSYTMKELHDHYKISPFPLWSLQNDSLPHSCNCHLAPSAVFGGGRSSCTPLRTRHWQCYIPPSLGEDNAQQTISLSSCLDSIIPSGVCPAIRLTLLVILLR